MNAFLRSWSSAKANLDIIASRTPGYINRSEVESDTWSLGLQYQVVLGFFVFIALGQVRLPDMNAVLILLPSAGYDGHFSICRLCTNIRWVWPGTTRPTAPGGGSAAARGQPSRPASRPLDSYCPGSFGR